LNRLLEAQGKKQFMPPQRHCWHDWKKIHDEIGRQRSGSKWVNLG
jgi:hypothetical protein